MNHHDSHTPKNDSRETKEALDHGFARFREALISEYKEITGRDWVKEEPREIGYHSLDKTRRK